DTTLLLQQLVDLKNAIDAYMEVGQLTMQANDGVNDIEFNTLDLNAMFRFLVGSKGSFEILLEYMNAVSNFFYHADDARTTGYFARGGLKYYRQREWRVISGLATSRGSSDRALTRREAGLLVKQNEFFGKSISLKDGTVMPIAQASRIISHFRSLPFWQSIR